jgi:hypothetical protein
MSVQTHMQISKDSKDNELNFSEKETYNYDFKSVCLKENVHLKREKNIDLYLLQFYLENKNRNLCDIINLNMYSLLYTLNKDNFEKIEIKKWLSDHEVEVLFLFKPFGKELGIKPKYMYVKSIEKIENGRKIYTGYDIEYPNLSEIAGYEKVNTAISNMVVNFESNNKVNINYIFKLDLSHSLPIYMENILGLIMKKMFIHLKKFIESVNF